MFNIQYICVRERERVSECACMHASICIQGMCAYVCTYVCECVCVSVCMHA